MDSLFMDKQDQDKSSIFTLFLLDNIGESVMSVNPKPLPCFCSGPQKLTREIGFNEFVKGSTAPY